MLSFIAKVYEKAFTSTVSMDSLVEHFKIDESLDSAVMTMPRTQRKTQFSRFAPVKITVSDGTTTINHWWLIYTPKVVLSGFGAIPKYDHTLGLIEPTKWLEKFACGTLTFTQPIGGTRYTLLDVVARLINLTPFVPYSQVASTRLFSVDSTLATYLDSIKAPQLYFDKKNLREALIETFKYINAIPRLTYDGTNWVLNADFINQRKLDFDIESQILDYSSEASGENYGHKAEVYHENTIPTEDESQTNTYENSITNATVFKTDNVILGDSNYKIILTNKCYKLLSIKAYLNTVDAGNNRTDVLDLTTYVVEKKVWDTLDITTPPVFGSKPMTAYWQYGSEIIDGFSEAYDIFGLTQAYDYIRNHAVNAQYAPRTSTTKWDNVSFLIEYIPYIEQMRSEQYREDKAEQELQANMRDYYATIQLNPQERINSLYQLTNNVYGQIQRLGVDTISFAKKHKVLAPYNGSNNGIYQLGDYTADGYFITNAELVYFNTFVIARYEMSKNWNRYAQFINIDKEFRPYEITLSKSDFVLNRPIHFQPMVIEVSNTLNGNHLSNSLITPFMNTLGNSTYQRAVNGAVLEKSLDDEFAVPPSFLPNSAVYMPLTIGAEKNTIKMRFQFNDTKLAGKRVTLEAVTSVGLKYYKQYQVPYTFENGTLPFARISLYQNYWSITAQTNFANNNHNISLSNLSKRFPFVDLKHNVVIGGTQQGFFVQAVEYIPANTGEAGKYYVDYTTRNVYLWDTGTSQYVLIDVAIALQNQPTYQLPIYNILKDTSEIGTFEIALPIIPNKDKINKYIIGDSLTQENVLVKPRSTARTFKWVAVARMFDKTDTKVLEASDIAYSLTTAVSISGNAITIPNALVDDYPTYNYALLDSNNNIYIAVNRRNLDGTGTDKADINTIYFNFLNERG